MSIRVLVVDDSILYRKVLTEALNSLPAVEVVGGVANGGQVVGKVRELRPDVLTLDIEMPGMNGIEVMNALRQAGLNVNVLVVSSVTLSGGVMTLQALENGAFDFITKPQGATREENKRLLREALAPRLRALGHRLDVQKILRSRPACGCSAETSGSPVQREEGKLRPPAVAKTKPELVVIGVSTGGPNALATIVSDLPRLNVPILIVQHMPPIFTRLLAENLSSRSLMPVREASHNEEILADEIYLAPGGKQMRLIPNSSGARLLQLSDDPPENSCRPSVDYLFRSVANHFPGKALAVILTGMGDDGTAGLRLLKRTGSNVIAQDQASCVVYGMPKAAIDAGLVDVVAPLCDIATNITRLVRGLPA
jgi:two-component system, chemotaxis family, protein-glutamate methylesterase/glutaminase